MISYPICLLIFLSLCVNSYAFELTEIESKTVDDLLLFYNWEDLVVEAPTRRPTKLQYVAENISIITADEIAAMNAHNVGEVLQTVNGVFFSSYGHEIN